MFLTVERATTRNFVRVLVILLAAALLCGSYPIILMARETDRAPCEMPGDADGVGGYKNFEFEGASSGTSDQPPSYPMQQSEKQRTTSVFVRQISLVLHFYLITRR